MHWVEKTNMLVWGLPTVALILFVGLLLSIRTGCFQVRKLPHALISFGRRFCDRSNTGNGVSPYQALCTALAATVGTGNIAGVAGAICLGGPGAILWMWVGALFGMLIKCCEATLAVRYRRRKGDQFVGGPMYYIHYGLGPRWRWLSVLYAFLGVVAAFGVGNATQINSVISGISSAADVIGYTIGRPTQLVIAVILAFLVAWMLTGGARSIGAVAEKLVPYASCIYILLGLGVLVFRAKYIPEAVCAIVEGAFSPRSVTGGVIGSVFIVCRIGAARGIFTNEAGMGTAAIAHAGADVRHPVDQGLMGMIEVFLDTIVICTVTALVILCSGIEIPYGQDMGASLTSEAFSVVYGGWASVLIAACLVCFAFATILGWGYYGMVCAEYLFGSKIRSVFIVFQVLTVLMGAMLKTGVIWMLAETVNGLMAIPNLIALLLLSPEFYRLIKSYSY